MSIDKESRRTMNEITNGFNAMLARMGIPPIMLTLSNSRELIEAYFEAVASEALIEPE
jgi:hypothetical protein